MLHLKKKKNSCNCPCQSIIMQGAWCHGENTGLENLGLTFYSQLHLGTLPYPGFLIHNMVVIILSPCLSVRDVVRLRKTTVWKQFLFLCHLPLSISTPQFQSSSYSYISMYLFFHFHPGGFHPLLWRRSWKWICLEENPFPEEELMHHSGCKGWYPRSWYSIGAGTPGTVNTSCDQDMWGQIQCPVWKSIPMFAGTTYDFPRLCPIKN